MPETDEVSKQPNTTAQSARSADDVDLTELVKTLRSESRKSALIGFLGGALVVAGLGVTFYSATQSRNSLKSQISKTETLQTEVTQTKSEAKSAKQQAATAKAVLSATVENFQTMSPAASTSATQAVNQAFQSNPNAVGLWVRIYIHMHSPEQRQRAFAIAKSLRAAGFLVPGIDVKTESVKETEIHYYSSDNQSVSDAASIAKVLTEAGIQVIERQVPAAKTDDPNGRLYGLWLASDLK